MVQFTLEHMIFSVFLIAFLIVTSAFATQYITAQSQVALRVELRNTVLLVEQELLDACRAANATQAPRLVMSLPVPKVVQGQPYRLYLYGNGTLRGVVGQVQFHTQLPALSGCVWSESSYTSGSPTLHITATYSAGRVTLTISP